jgi:hypothetical protein
MTAIVRRVRSSVNVLSLLLVVMAEHATAAPDRRLWGTLEPGPHPVGFTRSWQLDPARQYAPEFRAEDAGPGPAPESPRPILVNLWYPARESGAPPMRYRDYLDFGSDNPLIAPFAKRLDAFTRRTIAEEVLEERPAKIDETEAAGIERWLDATTHAIKDAPVAAGKFPLIVAHPGLGGTFEDNSVFYEYMASHGYAVVVAPYQSENAAYLNIDWDLDRSIKDMDFLVRFAKARPGFELGTIGAIGHSYGAQAVLAWRAEQNSPLAAVVSLDSTVEYNAPDDPGLALLSARLANPERLAGPILAYASKDEKPNFLSHWSRRKYTRLYTVAVSNLEHNDFVTQGAARFAFLPGRKTSIEKASAIRAGYDRVCLYTRKFFDAHLKANREAELFLKRAVQDKKLEAAGFAMTVREPSPLPPTGGQLVDLALRDGIDAAIRLARRFRTDVTEESLGDAGDGLFVAGKRADGIALMRQRCELYPTSWGAQVFLADRLLDGGDRAGALAAFRKAQQLIASGAKPKPSERVFKMIANGLKKAEGK